MGIFISFAYFEHRLCCCCGFCVGLHQSNVCALGTPKQLHIHCNLFEQLSSEVKFKQQLNFAPGDDSEYSQWRWGAGELGREERPFVCRQII